jgi:hypothetical protein
MRCHMRSFSRLVGCLLVWLCFLVVRPHDAHALEVAGTASLGGFVAGPTTRFAVSLGLVLRLGSTAGFNLAAQNSLTLFPGSGPFGFVDQTSLGAGFSHESFDADLAPALSFYRFYSCGDTGYCGYVVGAAPGGRARVSYFPTESWGATLVVDVNWFGGRSTVLREGPRATVALGPAFRWQK